jgi:hypothetical protein
MKRQARKGPINSEERKGGKSEREMELLKEKGSSMDS